MTLNLLLDGLTSSSTLPYLGMFVLDVQSFSLVGVFGSRSNMIVLICFFFSVLILHLGIVDGLLLD